MPDYLETIASLLRDHSRNNTESSAERQHFPHAIDSYRRTREREGGRYRRRPNRYSNPRVNRGQTEQYVAFSRHYSRPLIASGPRMEQPTSPFAPSPSLPRSLPRSSSLSLHNARYPAGTMRDSAGYETPQMLGAHLTRPTTPGTSLDASAVSLPRALPFPGGALSLAVAQDYRL